MVWCRIWLNYIRCSLEHGSTGSGAHSILQWTKHSGKILFAVSLALSSINKRETIPFNVKLMNFISVTKI